MRIGGITRVNVKRTSPTEAEIDGLIWPVGPAWRTLTLRLAPDPHMVEVRAEDWNMAAAFDGSFGDRAALPEDAYARSRQAELLDGGRALAVRLPKNGFDREMLLLEEWLRGPVLEVFEAARERHERDRTGADARFRRILKRIAEGWRLERRALGPVLVPPDGDAIRTERLSHSLVDRLTLHGYLEPPEPDQRSVRV